MPRKSYSAQMLELVTSQAKGYAKDQHGNTYIDIETDDIDKRFRIKSRDFKGWMAKLLWDSTQKTPGHKAINEALLILEGKAVTEGAEFWLDEEEAQNDDKLKQADRIIELVLKEESTFYLDERKEAYIFFKNVDGCYENHKLASSRVRAWLTDILYTADNKAPNSESIQAAINLFTAKAYRENEVKLYNRVALNKLNLDPRLRDSPLGGVLIDMTDPEWRMIRVTADGWSIQPCALPVFRREPHQRPLPVPVSGGSLDELIALTNIPDPLDQLLYKVYGIYCFIPGLPHPIFNVYGQQGSGKTWQQRILRHFIDPSHVDELALPRKISELQQLLDQHYMPIYDNVTRINQEQSDAFCRASTGGGTSQRKLYTNNEAVFTRFHSCPNLNGINVVATQGDMLERGLNIKVPKIEKRDRVLEDVMKARLEECAPRIMGAMLDTLSKAIKIYPTVELEELERMADFTKWGYAITEALGEDPELFLKAYRRSLNMQSVEAVNNSIAADMIKAFILLESGDWVGTPTELFTAIMNIAKERKVSTTQRGFPKAPNMLSRELNRLAPDFPSVGIIVEEQQRSNTKRLWSIKATDLFYENNEPTEKEESKPAPHGAPSLDRFTGDIKEAILNYLEEVHVVRKELFFVVMHRKGISKDEAKGALSELEAEGLVQISGMGTNKTIEVVS